MTLTPKQLRRLSRLVNTLASLRAEVTDERMARLLKWSERDLRRLEQMGRFWTVQLNVDNKRKAG